MNAEWAVDARISKDALLDTLQDKSMDPNTAAGFLSCLVFEPGSEGEQLLREAIDILQRRVDQEESA